MSVMMRAHRTSASIDTDESAAKARDSEIWIAVFAAIVIVRFFRS